MQKMPLNIVLKQKNTLHENLRMKSLSSSLLSVLCTAVWYTGTAHFDRDDLLSYSLESCDGITTFI